MKILAIPLGELNGNSCQHMLYKEMERTGCEIDDYRNVNSLDKNYDIIHVHWPELFANGKTIFHVIKKSLKFAKVLRAHKKDGAKIVWTCHNVVSHNLQYPVIEKYFMKWFVQKIDGVIAPLQYSYQYAVDYFPAIKKKPFSIIATGHYLDVYPNEISRTEAKEKLGINNNDLVIGFIGNISPYKGIFELLNTFSNIKDNNIVLLVAGKTNNIDTRERVEKAAQNDHRIHYYWGLIPNEDMQLYFNASDLIALPFQKINNSGSLYLTLGFNKPVLIPDFPQMKEAKERFGKDLMILYKNGQLEKSDVLHAIDTCTTLSISKAELESMNYDILAGSTISFFTKVIDN